MNRIQHFSYLRGRVVNTVGHGNLPDVTVILSLVSGRQRTQVAQTTTNASGKFVIDVEAATQRGELPRAGRYELSVRKAGAEAKITGGRWRWFQGDDPGDVQLCVTMPEVCDAVPPAPPGGLVPGGGPPTVVGRVLHHDGTPVSGVAVRARDFQIDGASDTALGSTTTDSQGWYGIAFSPPGVGVPPRNLFVEVLNTDSPARMLGVSSPKFGAIPPVRIDLNIWDDAYRAPNEWAQYNGPLDDARDTLSFDDITWSAVSFLAGRTKVPVLAVCAWRDAHRLAQTLDLEIDHVAEALYGLLRTGFPPDLRVMELRGSARIAAALELALRENFIGLAASLIFEDLAAGLTDWRVSLYSDGADANSLTALFSASGLLSADQVTDIVAHYATYVPADGPFWDTVAALDEFESDAPAVLEARRLVTLAGLAFSHAPTVAAITTAISNGAAALTATLAPSAWTTLVGTIPHLPPGVEGETNSAQRANYAVSLRENAMAAFPGAAVGFAVRADTTLGGVYDFATLTENTEFDFEKDDVLERIEGEYRWAGTDAERSEAAAFQRVSRIAPTATRFASAKAIYGAGLRSAHAIARRGPTRSVAKLVLAGLTPSDARLTVVRAQQAAGKALTLFTQAHANLTGVKLSGDAAWPNGTGLYSRFLATTASAPPSSTLEAVFGNVDFCTCRDCRSITGPAAYLVDLLHWLDEREGWDGKLKDRRPDLGLLLLSCENTHRTLPYIDLAQNAPERPAIHD